MKAHSSRQALQFRPLDLLCMVVCCFETFVSSSVRNRNALTVPNDIENFRNARKEPPFLNAACDGMLQDVGRNVHEGDNIQHTAVLFPASVQSGRPRLSQFKIFSISSSFLPSLDRS